jgi:tetratricopeptide (TPR) repeat protein
LYAEAIRHLGVVREVYASSGEAGQALLILGELFREQRKSKEADAAYKDVLGVKEWRPLWPEALYGRGLVLMQDRKYVEASAYFERIYLMYAGYQKWASKAYLRRAECLERISDRTKAIETLRDMLAHSEFESLPEAAEARELIQKLGGQL